MATYGNSIYQYENPTPIDISMLGKAVQFKQENYDANTMNVQNLVTQYLNMDLARDVDKQYLGERLQTLTNYVNNSGQKDWSRTSVAREVSTYIGNAIDDNVTKAVASTKMKRKQDADLQALRTKNPELYNQANEWKSTEDWNRYVTSNQLGDVYRPQAYTNYVDVNKRVMELTPKLLKDFGVQIVYQDEMGSTPMFRRVGSHEIVTGEEAKKFTNMVLGDDGKTQLAINSQFKGKDYSADDVKKTYGDYIDFKVDALTKQKNSFIASKGGATATDKKVIDQNTASIDGMITDLETLKRTQTSKESMLYNMELDNFTSGWGDALSYDKTVSINIDDSGYKLAQFDFDMKQKQFENQLALSKFDLGAQQSDRDYQLKLAEAIGDGKVTIDPMNGLPVANVGGIGTKGVTVTPNETVEGDEVEYNINNIEREYTDSYKIAYDSVKADMNDPEKRKRLEKEFGSLENADIGQIVANFVNKGGIGTAQSKLANATKKGLFSENTLQALRTTQERYTPIKNMDTGLIELDKEVSSMVSKTIRHAKGEKMYGMSDYYVDAKGEFKSGDYYLSNDKQYSDLNNNEKIGAKLNYILMQKRRGDLSDNDMAYYKALERRYLAQLPANQRIKASEALTYEGESWKSLNTVKRGLEWVGLGFNKLIGDTSSALDNSKEIDRLNRQADRINRDEFAPILDVFNRGYDYDDIRIKNKMNLKVDNKVVSPQDYINTQITPIITKLSETAQSYRVNRLSNNTINVDTSIKGNDYALSVAKAMMPNYEIVKDSNVAFNINDDGTATISAMVKDGKESVLNTQTIPMTSIPQNLLSQVNTNKRNFAYDAEGLKMGYTWNSELLPTRKKVLEEFGDNISDPYAEGIQSKEDLLNITERTYGKKFVDDNKKYINEVLNQEVKMEAKLVNGTYVMDITAGDFSERRNLNTTNLGDQIDLLTAQKERISSEFVLRNLNSVLNKLKN